MSLTHSSINKKIFINTKKKKMKGNVNCLYIACQKTANSKIINYEIYNKATNCITIYYNNNNSEMEKLIQYSKLKQYNVKYYSIDTISQTIWDHYKGNHPLEENISITMFKNINDLIHLFGKDILKYGTNKNVNYRNYFSQKNNIQGKFT